MRVLVVASLVHALFAPIAGAQVGDPWLIIPSTTSTEDAWIEPTAQALRRELRDRGIEVWSLERASTRFEEKESQPPARLLEAELQRWEARSEEALRRLTRGDYAQALELLDGAQELSRNAAEALNRDPARAEKVLDTCLYMVRALAQTGSESLADRVTQECRQLVLRGEPTAEMHPPKILELLSRVDAARAEQTGEIHVESEPSGCTVRIYGVPLGETPLDVKELFPGRYRVQIECVPEQPSRVHIADVGFARTEVSIDNRFDAVVETRPILLLHYIDAEQARHRVADANRITEILPTGALVSMHETSANSIEIELLRGTPRERQGLVRLMKGPEGPDPALLASATSALIDGKCMDLTGPEPIAIPCHEEQDEVARAPAVDESWPAQRTPRAQFISGLALVGVGSAALITGYALTASRTNVANDWINQVDLNTGDNSAQQKWLNFNAAIVLTSSVGAAALIAAMPLALPKKGKTPWWAWLSGGLGVGLAAFSVAYGVTAEPEPGVDCASSQVNPEEVRTCVRRAEQVGLAILTGLTAAPALTVPLVYLFRRGEKQIVPSVEATRSGGRISVRGRF